MQPRELILNISEDILKRLTTKVVILPKTSSVLKPGDLKALKFNPPIQSSVVFLPRHTIFPCPGMKRLRDEHSFQLNSLVTHWALYTHSFVCLLVQYLHSCSLSSGEAAELNKLLKKPLLGGSGVSIARNREPWFSVSILKSPSQSDLLKWLHMMWGEGSCRGGGEGICE